MVQHRDLTGASLHEPKGVETATAGQVYVANGTGSGTWQDRYAGVINLNKFSTSGTITDVSTPGSSFFVAVPAKSTLSKIVGVLSGAITVANDVITFYKNGIALSPTYTLPFTGSGAGVKTTFNISPVVAFNEGDVLEVRSDGASTDAASFFCTLQFTAVA